jgi:shikimate dehydrogenase
MEKNKMIDSDTIKIGLLGRTLKHSWSPLMHNRTLNRMGLNGIYLPLEVEEDKLAEAVRGLRALQFIGVNVTIPYKEKIMEYLDHVSDEARACGAVNLIKNQNGVLTGYNTDGKGFLPVCGKKGWSPGEGFYL